MAAQLTFPLHLPPIKARPRMVQPDDRIRILLEQPGRDRPLEETFDGFGALVEFFLLVGKGGRRGQLAERGEEEGEGETYGSAHGGGPEGDVGGEVPDGFIGDLEEVRFAVGNLVLRVVEGSQASGPSSDSVEEKKEMRAGQKRTKNSIHVSQISTSVGWSCTARSKMALTSGMSGRLTSRSQAT